MTVVQKFAELLARESFSCTTHASKAGRVGQVRCRWSILNINPLAGESGEQAECACLFVVVRNEEFTTDSAGVRFALFVVVCNDSNVVALAFDDNSRGGASGFISERGPDDYVCFG